APAMPPSRRRAGRSRSASRPGRSSWEWPRQRETRNAETVPNGWPRRIESNAGQIVLEVYQVEILRGSSDFATIPDDLRRPANHVSMRNPSSERAGHGDRGAEADRAQGHGPADR